MSEASSASSTFAGDAESYERFMGRWSRRLAGPFIDFAGLAEGKTGPARKLHCRAAGGAARGAAIALARGLRGGRSRRPRSFAATAWVCRGRPV